MATNSARGGRRRWMLHEEVRSGVAAVEEETLAGEDAEGEVRRYAFRADSVSYAVASRLLPQRLVAIWGLLIAGIALVAGLTYLDLRSAVVCEALGISALLTANWNSPVSLGGWLSNSCLWVAALLCLLTFGLRRHRLDDYRGKYRRWLGAAAVCIIANLLLSTGLHRAAAEALANLTGVTALPGHAVWWLVPVALVGTWVALRIALDMRPCRLGLFSLMVACGFYAIALAAHFAVLPASVAEILSEPIARCVGHIWLVAALLGQVRFILLEAAGQISPVRISEPKAAQAPGANAKHPRAMAGSSWSQQIVSPVVVSSNVPEPPKTSPARASEKKSLIAAAKGQTQWVDGRSSKDADDDDEEGRPLSKAERKRLRKEQSRNRAA